MENDCPLGYTRVTDVLRPFMDFSKIDKEVLDLAASRGKMVHTYCELYANNMLFEEIPESCIPYVDSFKRWFDQIIGKVVSCEKRLNDPRLKISGKYDLIATFKGSPDNILIDIKTPQILGKSWQFQLAAYKYLIDSIEGITIHRRMSVTLDRQGKNARVTEYCNHEEDQKMFMCALKLYRHFNG